MPAYLVKCSSCGTINRIPADKEGERGRCGKCGSTLPALYYQPQPLTDRTFNDLAGAYNGPILAEFWAPW